MGCEVIHTRVVIQEIVLDDVTPIASTYDKIGEVMRSKRLHEVPKNWLATNFHHGLRLVLSFLTHTSAKTTSQENYFHLSDDSCREGDDNTTTNI